MTDQKRHDSMSFAGRPGGKNNKQGTYLKTFEIPIYAVPSDQDQDTGIKAPKIIQAVSAYIVTHVPEVSAVVKTVGVGIVGNSNAFTNGLVNVAGKPTGVTVPLPVDNSAGANFSFTLAGIDFEEVEATGVLTLLCSDE